MRKTVSLVTLAMMLGTEMLGADPEVPTERLLYYNLVEAVLTTVTGDEGRYTATFQVTHVFKGDPGLHGKTFEFSGGGAGSTNGRPFLRWPMNIGGKSIWLLRKEEAGTLTWVAFGPRMNRTRILIVLSPVMEGYERTRHDTPYADVLAWAKTVEAAVKAQPGERYAILRKNAESLIRPNAVWAFAVMAEVDPEASKSLLRAMLERKELPDWKRIGLNRILSDLERRRQPNPKQLEPPPD